MLQPLPPAIDALPDPAGTIPGGSASVKLIVIGLLPLRRFVTEILIIVVPPYETELGEKLLVPKRDALWGVTTNWTWLDLALGALADVTANVGFVNVPVVKVPAVATIRQVALGPTVAPDKEMVPPEHTGVAPQLDCAHVKPNVGLNVSENATPVIETALLLTMLIVNVCCPEADEEASESTPNTFDTTGAARTTTEAAEEVAPASFAENVKAGFTKVPADLVALVVTE